MTLAPQRPGTGEAPTDPARSTVLAPRARPAPAGPGAQPWVMGIAVAVAVAGAALGLNGVLRGWMWYSPVLTTVLAVSFTMAALRSLRVRSLPVAAGGLAALTMVLTFTFFRQHSIAGFIPSGDTMTQVGRFLRRASRTVLAESAPVAPNAGIVMVACALLGVLVILIDALAFPLASPATSGIGILAILVVPAIIKPQSVGVAGFLGAAVGYLLILACSHWFAPDPRTGADSARTPGQFRQAALAGSVALTLTLLLQPLIPGFDRGTFPQGSRLNPFGAASGLNPMITLGSSLRSPEGGGRITYATNAPTTPYLRSVTVDTFDGEVWAPDDREPYRRPGTGRIDSGLESAPAELRVVTAIRTGRFTSPYLPVPYAPESVSGLTGRWSWDPATLSIRGTDTDTRDQQFTAVSVTPQLSAELLAQSGGPPEGVAELFVRPPANIPDVVRQTSASVVAGSATPYARAMAIQQYLRSAEFRYSLESPVQGGYDGNGMSVLADFLEQKSGYCIHFASAMAVMARLEGIPSRVAVGYAPGRPTGATVSVAGQGPLPEYEVDARDAHAWPELYFQGVGWVAFEPTPSRGLVPAYAAVPTGSGGASTNEPDDPLTPAGRDSVAPATPLAPVPLPGAAAPAGSGVHQASEHLGTGAAILLIMLLAAPRLARDAIRRRRLRSTGPASRPAPAQRAWAELRDLAADFGLAAGTGETARQFVERLLASGLLGAPGGMNAPAQRAAASLREDFEQQEYGRPPAGTAPGSASAGRRCAEIRIALLRAALRANAKPLVRLRAELFPPSVTAAWRQAPASGFRPLAQTARRTARGVADTGIRIRDAVRTVRRG